MMLKLEHAGKKYDCIIDDDTCDMIERNSLSIKFQSIPAKPYVFIKHNGKRVPLHRYLLGFPKAKEIDHINHDTLDNRLSNLRTATASENQQNRSGAQKNSKSGIRGVSWHKVNQRWQAQVELNGIKIHLGSFRNIGAAEKMVKEYRKQSMPFSEMDK